MRNRPGPPGRVRSAGRGGSVLMSSRTGDSMSKQKKKRASKSLQEEACEALMRATNARLVVRRGPRTIRYTITFSIPREP